MNYEKFEGKEVVCIAGDNQIVGIVTGCDRDIGISIQAKDDKKRYLLCLIGPSAPNFESHFVKGRTYYKRFRFILDCIKRGKIVSEELLEFLEKTKASHSFYANKRPDASSCPFNQ